MYFPGWLQTCQNLSEPLQSDPDGFMMTRDVTQHDVAQHDVTQHHDEILADQVLTGSDRF